MTDPAAAPLELSWGSAESSGTVLTVGMVGESPLMVAGMTCLLGQAGAFEVVDMDTAPDSCAVDLLLFDPPASGEERREATKRWLLDPRVRRVVFFTEVVTDRTVGQAHNAGASGVLGRRLDGHALAAVLSRIAGGEWVAEPPPSSTADTSTGIAAVTLAGGETLSVREQEVLGLVCDGLSNGEICQQLYLSINTVKSYMRTAYRKTGARNRREALIWAYEHGVRKPQHAG